MNRNTIRCAIYTRKSSDEGLEQSFNSLDAQREAGAAYVKSQAHEGWRIISTLYDDGGFSGGNMERPGLQRLLADVDAGMIDVVVVYKIDRLTRSLADFARIVERFDAKKVSFVSVTQSFNTTSSMGRLTLNVLLSFAQFEREVTGERIRDKIAASKAKGMWMGGNPPLGYELPASGDRILQVNEAEAETVRHIFRRYLELGSVHALQRELTDRNIFSKQRVTATGKTIGGLPFSRGAMFHMLRNSVYIGKIAHKGAVYDGKHSGIVDVAVFEEVQERLDRQARRHRSRGERVIAKAPLTGRLFDGFGEPMTPAFSKGQSGRLYRYYASASLQQGRGTQTAAIRRLPAAAFEQLVADLVHRWLPAAGNPLELTIAVRVDADSLLVDLPSRLASEVATRLSENERIVHASSQSCRIEVLTPVALRGGKRMIVLGTRTARPDRVLIAALRKAHRMVSVSRGRPLVEAAPASRYDRDILRLAFLAPDLQRDILAGHQPPALTLEDLRNIEIPLCWKQQRRTLGWPQLT